MTRTSPALGSYVKERPCHFNDHAHPYSEKIKGGSDSCEIKFLKNLARRRLFNKELNFYDDFYDKSLTFDSRSMNFRKSLLPTRGHSPNMEMAVLFGFLLLKTQKILKTQKKEKIKKRKFQFSNIFKKFFDIFKTIYQNIIVCLICIFLVLLLWHLD